MTGTNDEMSLEEARDLLLGHESPYEGRELTDAELDECASALDLDDEGAEEFDMEEAHRLAKGEEGETDL